MKAIIRRIVSLLPTRDPSMKHLKQQIPLYPANVPNAHPVRNREFAKSRDGVLRISNVSIPTLVRFPPGLPNGRAVIICPGGAYALLSFSKEGTKVAEEMARWGYNAFVLKYRLPQDTVSPDKSLAPIQDLQQAMRLVKQNAGSWGIDPERVGVLGFSAGAHVTAMLATRPGFKADTGNDDPTDLRPDFNILIYPVMSFDKDIAHPKSRNNLVGENASKTKLDFFSNELHVTPATPASFLVHAKDDSSVPVDNCTRFYEACKKNNVPVEMHLYDRGGHGFGMHNKTSDEKWMDKLKLWLDKL